jgi:gliotoxin/aspirochlorine biosynthesis aminotransferase
MVVGLALASNTTTSSLSAVFVSNLLTSSELLKLIALNSARLAKAYASLTELLRRHDIPYIPANAGIYLLAKIAPHAASWEDEAAAVQRFREAGVLVSAGKGYHGPEAEKGWARIGFAVEESSMAEALQRIDSMLSTSAPVVNLAQ